MWKVLNCVLKLSESVLGFTLKRDQELSVHHLFNCIDVMAVLPTEFEKSLIFQMFVKMCGVRNNNKKRTKNKLLEYHRDFFVSKHHTRSSK